MRTDEIPTGCDASRAVSLSRGVQIVEVSSRADDALTRTRPQRLAETAGLPFPSSGSSGASFTERGGGDRSLAGATVSIMLTKARSPLACQGISLRKESAKKSVERADSVSSYIADVPVEREKRDSLWTLLRGLIEQHGGRSPEDVRWAGGMLPGRRPG